MNTFIATLFFTLGFFFGIMASYGIAFFYFKLVEGQRNKVITIKKEEDEK